MDASRSNGIGSSVPARGRDKTFDRYFDEHFGHDSSEDVDIADLRRAAWATWKTAPPAGMNRPEGTHRRKEEEEDEELARAIAMSVQDQGPSRQNAPIDLTEDSDDEDIQRVLAMSTEEERSAKRAKRDETPEEERRMLAEAMAASLQPVTPGMRDASAEAGTSEERARLADASPTDSSIPSSTTEPRTASGSPARLVHPRSPAPRLQANGVLGDRAQMEKERLARQAAREAQTQPQASSSRSTAPPKVHVSSNLRTFADLSNSSSASSSSTPTAAYSNTQSADPHHPLQSAGSLPRDAAGEYYPNGEMRHSALTIGQPSKQKTFSPKQVMGDTSQISLIIMSSYVVDDAWIETFLPPADEVPRVVIRPHPQENHPAWNGKVRAEETGGVACYPLMVGGLGSAHMKFFWIFYKTGRLRVVISTGNLVHYDWEWIENTIFIQDILPIKEPRETSSASVKMNDFAARFCWLFTHLKVHKAVRHLIANHERGSDIPLDPADGFECLNKWDWSKVRVQLLMSVPGTYTGSQVDDFGLCRLGKILHQQGWVPQKNEDVKVEFQGSSLGAYTLDWLDLFYQYCRGKTTSSLLNRPKAIAWPPIKILFPSLATVDASILGRDGGGTMFCGKGMNSLTRPLFHDANSKRGGVLMHAKVLIGVFEPRQDNLGFVKASPSSSKRKASEMENESADVGGWVYVGSHNFSPAAWGRPNLKKNPPSLTIANYELGIVFPLPRTDTQKAADAIAPHVRPPRPYANNDVPWDQNIRAQNND
ncbi:hypothetical protein BD324DRAFT_258111 [Kockovaella imperatae]|uniref:Tyrosyl-DNA phosphodiesterase-domain-containing protein n=1 Tax=Kockovaella imperatae TaxID=4999 RepID=A0A1Y1UQ30_9TREE|nr:hypothetical protein BD324DRAFT_258111 [Kockovaella imperatae]ORX40109.1 hypothetical protein BD324DRAFT_258111 [Kockovaella imperatae]